MLLNNHTINNITPLALNRKKEVWQYRVLTSLRSFTVTERYFSNLIFYFY